MGVVVDAIKSLIPAGRLRLNADGGAIRDGIGDAVNALKTSGRTVITEAWPGTAIDTLPQWHNTLGVIYNSGRTQADQQTMLSAMMTAQGNPSLDKLQGQIQKEFPTIIINETLIDSQAGEDECGIAVCGDTTGLIDWTSYTLTGEVPDDSGGPRILAILARYGPAHMDPVSDLTVLSLDETSEAGADECGVAVAEGYDSGDLIVASFSVNPFLAGTAQIGTLLYAYPGTPQGKETPTISYQWRKNGVDIVGETLPYYLILSVGTYTCAVTARNSSGFVTFVPTGIASPNTVPVLTWAGTFTLNDFPAFPFPTTRTRTPSGVFPVGNPSPSVTFQWYKNGTPVSTSISWTDPTGTVANYELVITATSIAGSDSKTSGVFSPW